VEKKEHKVLQAFKEVECSMKYKEAARHGKVQHGKVAYSMK